MILQGAWNRILLVANGALVVLFVAQWQHRRAPALETPVVGEPIADVRVAGVGDARDDRISRLSDLVAADDCVVLYFFDPRCPACDHHAAEWSGFRELAVGRRAYQVIWVSTYADRDAVRTFTDRHQLRFRTARLRRELDRRRIGVTAWPLSYVVGPGLTFYGIGGAGPERVARSIERLQAADRLECDRAG